MASLASNACNASAQMLIQHAKEGNLVQFLDKETVDALVSELKKVAKPPKKSLKKSTERADVPFNPQRCSARLYSLACQPCGTDLYKNKKSEGEEFHYGLLNVQCNRSIHANGICAIHADTTKKSSDSGRCHETQELFLGHYNEEKPKNPIRISASGTKHHYVWLEDVNEEMASAQKKSPKKSSRTSASPPDQEKYEDRNWNNDLNTGDINDFKLNRLKLYVQHHGLPTHLLIDPKAKGKGKSKALSKAEHLEAIKTHIVETNAIIKIQRWWRWGQPWRKRMHTKLLAMQEKLQTAKQNRESKPQEDTHPPNKPQDPSPQEHAQDQVLEDHEKAGITFTTPDGIVYDLELGELYDQETGEKVGDKCDEDPKGWVPRKEAIMIHAQNIAKKMADSL